MVKKNFLHVKSGLCDGNGPRT